MAFTETPTTLFERVQGFVSDHKRAILIGAAAAVAVGGVAYYASTSARPPRGEPDVEKAGKKKKLSKGGKKKKPASYPDGPILEENVPPRPDEECTCKHYFQQGLAHSASCS